jgi:hypothetical protein
MTDEEVKKLKDGDYVEVEIDEDTYIGPIYHFKKTEKYLLGFYTEFCISKSQWELKTIGIKSSNVKRHLPEIISIENQMKKYYPQYFI